MRNARRSQPRDVYRRRAAATAAAARDKIVTGARERCRPSDPPGGAAGGEVGYLLRGDSGDRINFKKTSRGPLAGAINYCRCSAEVAAHDSSRPVLFYCYIFFFPDAIVISPAKTYGHATFVWN